MKFYEIMSSTKHLYDSQPLGWQIHEAAVKSLKGFDLRLGETYVWVREVIAEAKKTLAVEDIKLLPKTPSAKSRTRRGQRKLRSNAAGNNDVADISMEILPAKKTRKKASKAGKKMNWAEDSSVLNEISRLEDVDEEEDIQKTTEQTAVSMETTENSCSTETKNVEQSKENLSKTGYKTSDDLEANQPLSSRDVLNMATAILDGKYKASSVLSAKNNDYTPSSAQKLFGYVKSALSAIVPSLTTAPSETSDCVQQSGEENGPSIEKLGALSMNPKLTKKNPSSEMAEQDSKPLANKAQGRRSSSSKNGLKRSSLRIKVKRLSSSKRSSKRLSIKLLEAAKKHEKSEVEYSQDDVELKNQSIQVDMSSDEEIENTSPVRSQMVKSKAQHAQESKNSESLNLGGIMAPPTTDALPLRPSRFKTKETQPIVSPPTKKESQCVTKEDARRVGDTVATELRSTRSKTRDLQPASSTPVAEANSTNCKAGTPSTATRSKGNKIKELQELLCKDPGFGLKPALTAAAAADDDDQPRRTKRGSSKRQKDAGNDNESRAKRQCHETDKISPNQASASGSVQDLKNNVKGTYVSSCYPQLKKAATPNNQSTASFLQRNTPKVLNRQEMQEVGRKTLAVKVKKMEEINQKKIEELQKKAEEQKRLREEHHVSVLKRRQELEQSVVKKGASKLDETSSSAVKTNDREKSKLGTLRERRLAEAEQRRKQEEEARKQTLLQQEKEKQMLEEQQRRRKEQEEQERQQRIVEQRRQEEERRLRQERERQEEQQRLRKMELQRLKEEEEKRKQKEERERKEKAERERLELEKQQKKEKLRQMELEKEKELERQRIAEEQARLEAEQRSLEEKRALQKTIEKHNQTLKQGANVPPSASSNTAQTNASSNAVLVKCSAQSQPGCTISQAQTQQGASASVKPTLNTTFEKGGTAKAVDSYEMTPRIKKLKTTSTDSNYNIDDLNSEDSTDDESQPRKKIPLWAQGNQLKIALISQISNPPDVDKMFGHILSPDLNEVFTKKRARFNKRTSSANWDEPMLPPKTNTL